jgi:leucyl aminopeptidase
LDFSIKTGQPERQQTECLVLPVFANGELPKSTAQADRAAKGKIKKVCANLAFDAKPGSTLLLHEVPGIAASRLVLAGFGKRGRVAAKDFRHAVRAAIRAASDSGSTEVTLCLSDLEIRDHSLGAGIQLAATASLEAAYRFDRLKSEQAEKKRELERVVFAGTVTKTLETLLERGRAIGEGINLARDLGNLPPNICTPSFLAQQAVELGRKQRLKVTVLSQPDMEKLGMGALLAVARGSHQPPKLIAIEYRGAKKSDPPVALVGKGITFDTGGISLKPAAEMDEMKYDMSGAGSVLGTLKAIAQMKLPLNVIGIVPTTENMPGGHASRPGDVVQSMSGQTIEILNTDAEGRLILCDALTYAARYQPAAVIDIATLTGACVIALGHTATGLFANDDALADELLAAGEAATDRAWRMPLWDEYQEQLKSNFADMANIGGRPGGSITAACFLSRFTRDFKWAHLDIAGTAWKSGKEKGSTGRPVPLLTQFLMTRAGW